MRVQNSARAARDGFPNGAQPPQVTRNFLVLYQPSVGCVSRCEGLTSPHLIRLAAVPFGPLVYSERLGLGKPARKMQKENKGACVHDTQNEEKRIVKSEFVLP
jgi:hypothetical protein